MDDTFEIVSQLLVDVKNEFSSNNSLSSDLLKALWAVFPNILSGALDIIDHRGVVAATCPSGRTLYRVTGSSGVVYMCPSVGVYCKCPFFVYSVLRKPEYLMCKHVLAAKLASAMDLCHKSDWTDLQMEMAMFSMV